MDLAFAALLTINVMLPLLTILVIVRGIYKKKVEKAAIAGFILLSATIFAACLYYTAWPERMGLLPAQIIIAIAGIITIAGCADDAKKRADRIKD